MDELVALFERIKTDRRVAWSDVFALLSILLWVYVNVGGINVGKVKRH